MARMRVCNTPGCGELTDHNTRRCDTCRPAHELARGTSTQRGYGYAHKRTRKAWAPDVALGIVTCWRCEQRIAATDAWDMGHVDDDRTRHAGPEHVACNRATAGR